MPRGRGSPPWDVRAVRARQERRVWRREYLGTWADPIPETPPADAEFTEAVDAMCRAAYSGLGVDLAAGVRTGRLAGGPTIQQIPRDPVRAMGEEAAAREARIADALRCLRNITVQMTPAKPTPFKVPLARCAHPGGTCPNNCQDRPVAPTPLSRWWTDELSSGNYGDEWRVLEDF